jgi:hypothetical protein
MRKGIFIVFFGLLLFACTPLDENRITEEQTPITETLVDRTATLDIFAQTAQEIPITSSTPIQKQIGSNPFGVINPAPNSLNPTATSTPDPSVLSSTDKASNSNAVTNREINCRIGPATIYGISRILPIQSPVTITGKNIDTDLWWKVITDEGRECWVLGSSLDTSVNADEITKVAAPPLPTPGTGWNDTWVVLFPKNLYEPPESASPIVVTFVINGNSFFTKIRSAQFNGYIDDNGSLHGTMYSNGKNYTFHIYFQTGNLNQFRGGYSRTGYGGDFCGARLYTPLMSSCP